MTGLPADVKLIYEKCQNKEQIIQSDIRKFQNDLTINPRDPTSTQLELNFIRWPKGKLNFLIYKDGTIFQNLKQIKDQHENFCKLLMEIKEWNAQKFYNLYCNIEEQCLQHYLWVLPYCCHSKERKDIQGFIYADEFTITKSDLPIELLNSISTWSTTIYLAHSTMKKFFLIIQRQFLPIAMVVDTHSFVSSAFCLIPTW